MNRIHILLVCTACLPTMGLATSTASAQETITLKFAMAVPPTHYTAVAGGKFFMDRAVELSGGRLKFEWYPGEQLGKAKDLLSLAQAGVADIVDVVPSYVSDKLPLTGVAELPGQMESSCEGTKVMYALTRPGKILAEKDFAPQKMRVLMAATLAPYKILTATRPVSSLDDMSGQKIRSSGGATDGTIRALGAVSVRLAGPEINESLRRGTIDGAMYPFMSLRPFGIDSIRYAVGGANVGTLSTSFLISESKYKQLPPDIQKALDQAGKDAGENYCSYIDRHEKKEIDAMTEIKTVALSPEEAKRWKDVLSATKSEWAKGLDQRRKAGSEAVEAWDTEMAAVRASN